jgi:RimJ/RimL family protein N-acetyltransferase
MSGDHAATVRAAGGNLVLRYAQAADAPALLALASDPEVTRWFSWGPYRSVDEPLAFIAGQAAERDAGVRLDFLVDAPVGTDPTGARLGGQTPEWHRVRAWLSARGPSSSCPGRGGGAPW